MRTVRMAPRFHSLSLLRHDWVVKELAQRVNAQFALTHRQHAVIACWIGSILGCCQVAGVVVIRDLETVSVAIPVAVHGNALHGQVLRPPYVLRGRSSKRSGVSRCWCDCPCSYGAGDAAHVGTLLRSDVWILARFSNSWAAVSPAGPGRLMVAFSRLNCCVVVSECRKTMPLLKASGLNVKQLHTARRVTRCSVAFHLPSVALYADLMQPLRTLPATRERLASIAHCEVTLRNLHILQAGLFEPTTQRSCHLRFVICG